MRWSGCWRAPKSALRLDDAGRSVNSATLTEALACGRPGCDCAATARRGHGLTHCPAHDDRTPSLSVSEEGGKVLVHCGANCSQDAVLNALRERGLWETRAERRRTEKTVRRNGRVRYPLHDPADAHFIAVHVFERDGNGGKRVWWEQPDGKLGLDGIKTADLPLFGAHMLPDLPDGAEVLLVEGETPCKALLERGVAAVATVCGAGVTPSDASLQVLSRFTVKLWADNDPLGRDHMVRIAARLHALNIPCRIIEWRDAPDKGDAADFDGDADALRTLIDSARQWESEPIPDGAVLLDEVVALVRRYVLVSTEQGDAVGLWIAHTHCIAAADATPYLSITSPEKRSGKTRLEEVLDSRWRLPGSPVALPGCPGPQDRQRPPDAVARRKRRRLQGKPRVRGSVAGRAQYRAPARRCGVVVCESRR